MIWPLDFSDLSFYLVKFQKPKFADKNLSWVYIMNEDVNFVSTNYILNSVFTSCVCVSLSLCVFVYAYTYIHIHTLTFGNIPL